MPRTLEVSQQVEPAFIDLFAGCGGLSLGLMQAGWQGLFAVERERNAFQTLNYNLLGGDPKQYGYRWPNWLPRSPVDIAVFSREYERQLQRLSGRVALLAGGPPCQGFSFAGKRKRNDRRNQLIHNYMNIVDLVRPRFLIIENVEGIAVEFGKGRREQRAGSAVRISVADRITRKLEDQLGYRVFSAVLKAADVGVPQTRPRFIMIGIRKNVLQQALNGEDPFERLRGLRCDFLSEKNLPIDRAVTCGEAISDLETIGRNRLPCADSRGFEEATYRGPLTEYQRLMHQGMNQAPNSMRLVKHRPETIARFALALQMSRKGVTLSVKEKHRLGIMKKHQFKILDRNKPSATLTTLPDDLLHYSEPRVLTVREYARLQSFPDWFSFQGKYTTGGALRMTEAPRYTQVGNAVPPLMAELLGVLLLGYNERIEAHLSRGGTSASGGTASHSRAAAIA